MAKIERAAIEKNREFPEWLTNALAVERKKLASLDPVKRRLAEIELDTIEERTRTSLMEVR